MRQHDLLPLRPSFQEEDISSNICRSAQRRIQRKLEWESWANNRIETEPSIHGKLD